MLWTIFTTREYPPDDMEAFRREQKAASGLVADAARDRARDRAACRGTMRQLALGADLHLARPLLHVAVLPASRWRATCSARPTRRRRCITEGVAWAGICFAMYSAVCFAFSLPLPALAARLGRKLTHALCLLAGAVGLFSVAVIHDKYLLLLSMVGVGHRLVEHPLRCRTRSSPAPFPPGKTGVYMGDLQLLHRDPGDRGVAGLRLGDVAPAGQQPAVRPWSREACSSSWRRAHAARVEDAAEPVAMKSAIATAAVGLDADRDSLSFCFCCGRFRAASRHQSRAAELVARTFHQPCAFARSRNWLVQREDRIRTSRCDRT